jgi:hypothetical protein
MSFYVDPQSVRIRGGPSLDHFGGSSRGDLSYKSKCWAGFDSQFIDSQVT